MTTELEALIESTLSLIEESPTMITLVREPDWEDDGAGGKRRSSGNDVALVPKGRFFQSIVEIPQFLLAMAGEWVRSWHVLVGPPGDDIRKDDKFTVDGNDYQVLYVDPEKRFQVKAFVTGVFSGN
jgi:hypothetical protein